MTTSDLAELIEVIDEATDEDYDGLLEELLEEPYAVLEQQNN